MNWSLKSRPLGNGIQQTDFLRVLHGGTFPDMAQIGAAADQFRQRANLIAHLLGIQLKIDDHIGKGAGVAHSNGCHTLVPFLSAVTARSR